MILRFVRVREKPAGKMPDLYIDTIYELGKYSYSAMVLRVKDRPGVLAKILNVLAERGVDIAKVNVPEIPSGGEGFVSILMRNCGEACLEEVEKQLKKLDVVLGIRKFLPQTGFLFIKYNSIKLIDQPAVIVTRNMIRSIIDVFIKQGGYADLGTRNALRTIGHGIGKQLYECISKIEMEVGEGIEEYKVALNLLKDIYESLGFGIMDIIEVLPMMRYTIRIKNNMECIAARDLHIIDFTGYITRGILERFFADLFGRRAVAKETRCINHGDDVDEFKVDIYESSSTLLLR
ncbi:MAG: ACT domain-containing protein [Crenarchaeota archaeon]|nr:ACT domain-containing protein [Thermoproteota archaeon]